MKVLILAFSDWANMGNILTKCLLSVGVDAKFYTQNPTTRLKKGESVSKRQAINFSKNCDIIQYMHSVKVKIPIDLKGKKVVVYHGGSKYRQNSKRLNSFWNPIINCAIIQTYDLYGLGAKNEKWLLPPIDTKNLRAVYKTKNKNIIVGHYPSSEKEKGSQIIQRNIDFIKKEIPNFEYKFSSDRVLWEDQIKRLQDVDIYIEMMKLKQGDRQYGHWGMSALEAAALGKIVITNFFGYEEYIKQYGKCALKVANNEKELTDILIKLLNMPVEELIKLKIATRKWVEKNHSYHVVGSKLRSIYESL